MVKKTKTSLCTLLLWQQHNVWYWTNCCLLNIVQTGTSTSLCTCHACTTVATTQCMVLTVKPSPCCTMTSRRMSTSLCTCRRPSSDVNSGSSNANARTFRNSRVSKWRNALKMRTNQNKWVRSFWVKQNILANWWKNRHWGCLRIGRWEAHLIITRMAHTRTHAHTHARARTHTHTHTLHGSVSVSQRQ